MHQSSKKRKEPKIKHFLLSSEENDRGRCDT